MILSMLPQKENLIVRTKIPLLILVLFSLGIQPVLAAHILTNSDIVDLTKAKIPDSLIVDEIHRSKCDFSIAPAELIKLKKVGVSNEVLRAMINAGKPPATIKHPATVATRPPTRDVGVYYMKDGSWVNLPPEVVNWKTGGVLKSVASLHIVKGDLNGDIRGKDSPTSVTMPMEFLVVVPEGTYITEY